MIPDAIARSKEETTIRVDTMACARDPKLEEKKAELEALPVVGGTAYDWVKQHIEAGERLNDLASERAAVRAETPSDRGPAGMLRGATIGLIGRARMAMTDELLADKSLPRNLVEQTFGYFDELARMRTPPSKPTDNS